MDSVFYFVNKKDNVEKNILDYYACFTLEEIEKATVDDGTGTYTMDEFDENNIRWSGEFIQASLSTTQLEKILKYNVGSYNGPLTWMHVVMENRSSSKRALRALLNKLEKMTLASFPGKN
ncbi:MAG: hypothetical protein ACRDL7_01265, partial [Gaiellaceae bacterium]